MHRQCRMLVPPVSGANAKARGLAGYIANVSKARRFVELCCDKMLTTAITTELQKPYDVRYTDRKHVFSHIAY